MAPIPYRFVSALVLAGALYAAWFGIRRDAVEARAYAARDVFSGPVRRELADIERAIPGGEPILAVSASSWYPLLIQRYFYPRRSVVFVGAPETLTLPEFREFARLHRVRFAISHGDPPPDPGFLWHRTFPAFPGESGEVWVGEVRR